jgi:hypothetical protein
LLGNRQNKSPLPSFPKSGFENAGKQ